MCEPFEKTISVMDCGPYTPDGYVDLWATKAYASHQDEKSCPASLVTGEPVAKVRLGISNKKGFSSNVHIVKLENSLPVQECSKEIKKINQCNSGLLCSHAESQQMTGTFLTSLFQQLLGPGTAAHGGPIQTGSISSAPCSLINSDHPYPTSLMYSLEHMSSAIKSNK